MKKKIIVTLVSCLFLVTVMSTVIIGKDKLGFGVTAEHNHVGYHYTQKDAGGFEGGVKEYWVCCGCHEHFLEQPAGEFTDSSLEEDFTVESTDDRYIQSWADIDLIGMRALDSMKHGSSSYELTEITSGFISGNTSARCGLHFEKTGTINEYSDYEFKTNAKLEANTQYKMTWIVERYAGHTSAYSALRVGLKNIFRSSEGSFPMSGWDCKNNKIAGLNGVTGNSSSYSEVSCGSEGYIFTETATFTTGENAIDEVVVEINLNYVADQGSKCAITRLVIEKIGGEHKHVGFHYTEKPAGAFASGVKEHWVCSECEKHFLEQPAGEFIDSSLEEDFTVESTDDRYIQSWADIDLIGMRALGSMKHGSSSYELTEITSGFISGNTSARCGLHFEKTGTINEYSDYEFKTNAKLEANTQYKMTWIVERYAGHTSAYSALRVGLKNIFRSSEGSFPMSGWDCNNKKIAGLNGVTGNSSSYNEVNCGSEGYIFTETATFTTGENAIDEVVVEINLNYVADKGSKCAITRLVIEKVTA